MLAIEMNQPCPDLLKWMKIQEAFDVERTATIFSSVTLEAA